MLARVDALNGDIAAVEARIEDLLDPFADALERLDAVPGIGRPARPPSDPRGRHGHLGRLPDSGGEVVSRAP
jgi:hypothetical protein